MVEQLLLVEAAALKQRGAVHRFKSAAASIFRRCRVCVCIHVCSQACRHACMRVFVMKCKVDKNTYGVYGICGGRSKSDEFPTPHLPRDADTPAVRFPLRIGLGILEGNRRAVSACAL